MSLCFQKGSVYYNEKKKFYLLVTERTHDKVIGYTSRYGNPSMREKYDGLHIEKIGAMDFGLFKICFGNKFSEDVSELIPEKQDERKGIEGDFRFVRNLEKLEWQAFRLILGLHNTKRLVILEEDPDMPMSDFETLDVYGTNPFRREPDMRLFINT